MKYISQITFVSLVVLLCIAGCSPAATTTPIPTVSLATTNNSLTQVKASAVVVPAQESRLSFVISGIVEEVLVEEGSQVEAGQALVKLDTTEQDYNVEAAQIALNAAEIDAQIQRQSRRKFNMDTFSFIYVSAPEEKIQASDSKVDQMRSALDATKASLAQATLVAPSNSTVVKVDIAPGEYVHPGQVIVELARLDELQIETTDLSELNVAAVQIGQSATVFVEALDAEFPGKVTAISPISNTIGGDVVFTVTIQLDEQPAALLWGMSADVEINIE